MHFFDPGTTYLAGFATKRFFYVQVPDVQKSALVYQNESVIPGRQRRW